MKKGIIVAAALSFVLALTGCEEKKEIEATLEIGEPTLEVGRTGGNFQVNVTCNTDWTLTGGTTWARSDGEGGRGNGSVIIRVGANDGPEREAVFTFRAGRVTRELTVEQEADEVVPLPPVSVNEDFTDQNFLKYCLDNFDSDGDGILTRADLIRVEALYLSGLNISSLDGIEHFIGLKELNCDYNRISELDPGLHPQLVSLNCSDNSIRSLDLGANPALESLACAGNGLQRLELSGCPRLKSLDCGYNELTGLSLSDNPLLEQLDCYENSLAVLDVSSNTALISLNCPGNPLTALDLRSNVQLFSLDCSYTGISSLDLDNLQYIMGLYIAGCRFNSLDVSGKRFLSTLGCGSNREMNSLNVEGCYALYSLDISGTAIRELNVSSCQYLSENPDAYLYDLNAYDTPLEVVHVWPGITEAQRTWWTLPEGTRIEP